MGSDALPADRQPEAAPVRRGPGPAPYAVAWTVAAAIACATGLVVLALDAPTGQVLAVVAASLGMGAVGGFLFMAITERFEARLIAAGSGWTCLALTGGWGLFRIWPSVGGGAVVLLAVSSPWSLEGIRRLTAVREPRPPRGHRVHHGFTVDHPAVLGFLEDLGRAATAPVFPLHPLPDFQPDPVPGDGPELVGPGGAPIDDIASTSDDTGSGSDDKGGPKGIPVGERLDDIFELRAADPDEVLCEAWVASSVALGQTGTTAGRLAVIRSRQFLLDQLEKRDPEAFAGWLASRPHVEDDPSAYFVGHGGQQT